MANSFDALLIEVYQLIDDLPHEMVRELADELSDIKTTNRDTYEGLFAQIPNFELRQRFSSLIKAWKESFPDHPNMFLAIVLRAVAESLRIERSKQKVELVWTGPNRLETSTRHSGEVLIELVNHAQQSLHLVSFALYQYKPLIQAMLDAVSRGVKISMYIETHKSDMQPIEMIRRFSSELVDHVELFIWPKSNRIASTTNTVGSLHAKLAIADADMLFISSANLTEYALTINLEAGVLFHGGDKPKQIIAELNYLVRTGIFEKSHPND